MLIITIVQSKKFRVSLVLLLLVAFVIGFFAFKSGAKNEPLTSVEVFNEIDFKAKAADVEGHKIEFRNTSAEHLIELKLSNDEKTLILKALESATFEKISNANISDSDYLININLNKRYEIYLDSKAKQLLFANEHDHDSNHLYYQISNDGGLFKLLEQSTKETLQQ